ncbi:hypothetical protein JI666_17480 [Bacillus sp. NTK071]|uniref:hypothetical protein n=1 Tax=Bacillus sp. NTK071 TaxID=2802175 RepID=UPI001A8EB779|nr:hypothetical protein [Bacillus sp. NTK071]MBN8210551.1 hypothetical protein [Bacillus sp. NTK071]
MKVKTVIIALLSFLAVSGILLFLGQTYQIEVLMFQFYNETSDGFEAGGSIAPFVIGGLVSYLMGRWFENRKSEVSGNE